jgi:hypothetical protein
MQLEPPEAYMARLKSLRQKNRYAAKWTLRVDRKTSRHVDTSGHCQGWYEVFPLGITVGWWGCDRDDLKGVDRDQWNQRAKELSQC